MRCMCIRSGCRILQTVKNPETFDGGDFQIIEVSLASEEDEYANGHIPGAINVNADEINHVPGPRALADYEVIPMEEQLKYWNRPLTKRYRRNWKIWESKKTLQ